MLTKNIFLISCLAVIFLVASPAMASVKLSIPFHHQQHNLSCEAASLFMALNYKGATVTENSLIKQLPVSDSGARHKGNIWGDPELGFVGNINGHMPNSGYGVYTSPIYNLATNYRDAKIINSGDINDLIAELVQGNPVVVWGVYGRTRDISWKTSDGKKIHAMMNEHARVLIGFTGTPDNPKQMILMDPIAGELHWSVSTFLNNWALMDKKAVAIE